MRPDTIYGVCKVTGELLSDYYYHRFGVDARSVRFPGIISNGCLPGGGTTDYAVEVFYEILKTGHYTCPIPEDSYMDMLYMPDALNAVVQLMEADPSKLKHRNSFNITCMSFCPKELFAKIKERIPSATFDYNVDPVKAAIADSWPNMMDDSCAREEWGWNPQWHIDAMVAPARSGDGILSGISMPWWTTCSGPLEQSSENNPQIQAYETTCIEHSIDGGIPDAFHREYRRCLCPEQGLRVLAGQRAQAYLGRHTPGLRDNKQQHIHAIYLRLSHYCR